MNDEVLESIEESQLSRRGLLVKGGLAAAGLTALGGPTAAAFGATEAAAGIKVAVVTHGDTGSFWSVFKKGVDQAARDLKGRGVSVTQVYANNNVAKQVSGIRLGLWCSDSSPHDPSSFWDLTRKSEISLYQSLLPKYLCPLATPIRSIPYAA